MTQVSRHRDLIRISEGSLLEGMLVTCSMASVAVKAILWLLRQADLESAAMVEVYSSKILRRKWQAVTDFILAAEAFRDDRENEELRQNVAEAAGRADGAAKMTGMITVHTDPPVVGGRSTAYDAIAAWDSTIDPFTDQLLVAIDVAYQVRGRLESMADDAEREERSLVGWVARLVGFPGRVRRHLADRGFSSATQSAGFAVSIVVQVLAALATGLAVTWIVSQLGW